MTKKATYLIFGVATIYAIVYFYQRYKRNKTNEIVVPYDEAISILEETE